MVRLLIFWLLLEGGIWPARTADLLLVKYVKGPAARVQAS